MTDRFYITTPIYYVNARPHIGHTYTTILSDFLIRFHKMLGTETYFLTGTDEHGDKIAKAALEKNTAPQEYVDGISLNFRETWKKLGIQNDDFIRTTEERHKTVVKTILQKVYDKGDIYFGSYGGRYCVGCERFLTDKEIINDKCPDHDRPLEFIEEKNYFFKMSKYQDRLVKHIESNPEFIKPEKYKNEVLSMLRSEVLEDLCISRPKSRLSWGIDLPFDSGYVTYVWFDALINYISAIGYPDSDLFKKFWPESRHIIGKDILKPHGIFWPTMLMSAGIDLYRNLCVHGFWNNQNVKISKSLGNVVPTDVLIDTYGNDQIRYFLIREMTFGNDANYSDELIINRINYDLGNDLGNLINRSIAMTNKFYKGSIPEFCENEPADRKDLEQRFKTAADGFISDIKNFQTGQGLEKIWEFIRYMNKYIDINKPWQLHKEGKIEALQSVIRNILESIYSIVTILSPILIESSVKIKTALKNETGPADIGKLFTFSNLDAKFAITDPGILFPRHEKTNKENKMVDTIAEVSKSGADQAGLVDISEFARIDIRVAKILTASRIEGSEKLLELKVDSGLDERVILAGIAKWYDPDWLVGKKILLVSNLKPAAIFKRKSNGMLLAAKKSADDKPELIVIDDSIQIGARLG